MKGQDGVIAFPTPCYHRRRSRIRRRWRAWAAIRLAIAVSAIHLAILFVFGRYPKSLSVLDDTFVASAAAVFALFNPGLNIDPTANGAEFFRLDVPRIALAGTLLVFLVAAAPARWWGEQRWRCPVRLSSIQRGRRGSRSEERVRGVPS